MLEYLTFSYFLYNFNLKYQKNRLYKYIHFLKRKINSNYLVGRVGYAPTTPAMSMQYSTIELTAQNQSQLSKKLLSCFDLLGCFNFLRAFASI